MKLIRDWSGNKSKGRGIKLFLKEYPLVELVYNSKGRNKRAKPVRIDKPCCPFCGQPLERLSKKERIQDTIEHCSNPNGTPSLKPIGVCVNEDCRFTDLFKWTLHDGGCCYRDYFDVLYNKSKDDKILGFRPGMEELYNELEKYYTSATNTFDAKCDIEIYKYGLIDEIRLNPILGLGLFQPIIEVKYEANDQGEIIKKHYKFHESWYNKEDKIFTHYSPGFFSMFKYEYRKLSYGYKRYRDKTKGISISNQLYHEVFVVHKNSFPDETRSWYRCAKYLMRLRHPFDYLGFKPEEIENYKDRLI